MGIYAIGVDVVEIPRIQKLIESHGDRFLHRVFTPAEIAYCQQKATPDSFAVRFAAKEAVFKATGHGLRLGMRWRDVEVLPNAEGKPILNISGKTRQLMGQKRWHLSLSHTHNLAVAVVVVENVD